MNYKNLYTAWLKIVFSSLWKKQFNTNIIVIHNQLKKKGNEEKSAKIPGGGKNKQNNFNYL